MSKVHKNTLFQLTLDAEDRLSDGCSRGSMASKISVCAGDVLDLCADSDRLSQLERLEGVGKLIDTEGLRAGAAAMEQYKTSKPHEYDIHCACGDCMDRHHARALRNALEGNHER